MKHQHYYFGDKTKGEKFFISQLSQGHKWSLYLAERLGKYEIGCHVEDMRIAETVEERSEFYDEKDLTFTLMPGYLEVKSQSRHFTDDPQSWPLPSTIVDTVLGWERKDPRPLATVLVSIHTGGAIVIPSSTEHLWKKQVKYDTQRKINDTFFVAHKSLLRPFHELADWLVERQNRFNT